LPHKKGRPSNVDRDYWIVKVLARLVAVYKVPLTRSRRPAVRPRPGLSACAIVAQALEELGIKLNEAGVEAVWSKRRPQLTAREINGDSPLPSQRDREIMDARVKALMGIEVCTVKIEFGRASADHVLSDGELPVDGRMRVGVSDGQANAARRSPQEEEEEKGQ
jgi:hypothetical protein